jgi:hypothetical protein
MFKNHFSIGHKISLMPKKQFANDLPEWMAGWQNDGRFVAPNSSDSIQHPNKIEHLITPPRLSPKELIGGIEPSTYTQNSYAMLAILTSLAAPFFYQLRKPGICLHFYGNSKAARQALLYSASSVWESDVYEFKEVHGHMYGLKIFHKDTALCLSEVQPNRKKDLHKFLRRYFGGREGADVGVSGVVISTGEKPIAPSNDQESGLNALIENKHLLAINICLGAWPNQYAFKADPSIPPNLVNSLIWDLTGTVSRIYDEQLRLSRYETTRKGLPTCEQVTSFFWLLNAIANYIGDKGGLDWWRGGGLPPTFQKFIDEVDSRYNTFINLLKIIAGRLPIPLKFGDYVMVNPTPYIKLKADRVLIPAEEMQRLVPAKSLQRDFTSWLSMNGIILTRRKGKICDTFYSSRHKKPISGYKVDAPKILEMLSNYIQ